MPGVGRILRQRFLEQSRIPLEFAGAVRSTCAVDKPDAGEPRGGPAGVEEFVSHPLVASVGVSPQQSRVEVRNFVLLANRVARSG